MNNEQLTINNEQCVRGMFDVLVEKILRIF